MCSGPLLLQAESGPGGAKGGPASLDTPGMKRSLAAGWILLLGWFVACAQAGPPPQVRGSSAPAWILWPVEGKVSSAYGNPRGGAGKRQRGIDIRTQPGTPIRASAAGRVSFSGRMRGYGNIVMLEHGGGFETRYARNRKNLVEEGDWVGT
jgi:murein DD-endopeptidase MepM/ murein hydrolase activator NlpD